MKTAGGTMLIALKFFCRIGDLGPKKFWRKLKLRLTPWVIR
jgi:hypothetical protein